MSQKKRLTNSLGFKTWVYFSVFAVAILSIVWICQVFLLEKSYSSYKANRIEEMGKEIVSAYGEDDFYEKMDYVLLEEGINVILYKTRFTFGNMLEFIPIYPIASRDADTRKLPPQTDFFDGRYRESISLLYDRMKQNATNEIAFTENVEGIDMVLYGYYFEDANMYLYLGSSLESLGTSIDVLSSQLSVISIGVLILSFFLSILISHLLNAPIVSITDTAELLASGKYDIEFKGKGYSEVEKLSKTLNYACCELSKMQELKENLIANVSHDLRTPLTLIKAYAEMLRDLDNLDGKKKKENLSVIIDEADRLTTLVNDILDLSKIQAGMALEVNEFSLSDLVNIVVYRFGILTEKEGYTIESDISEGIYIVGDAKRIEQAVYNLIGNAVNYTGNDKKIKVSLKTNGKTTKFMVSDSGKGIAKEKINKIWEKYYQSKDSHERAIVGTGLGLSIVKEIFEVHKIAYGVDSTVGKGSTFWFEVKN